MAHPKSSRKRIVVGLAICAVVLPLTLAQLRQNIAQERPRELTMPGESFRGPLPLLSDAQQALSAELRRDVKTLAGDIGERNLGRRPESLRKAAEFIEQSFTQAGFRPRRETYEIDDQTCVNIVAEIPGAVRPAEIVVVGAHYDSVIGCPGANDNGTGVAGCLALARHFAGQKPERTLRLVAFANEEPPYFQTESMGSWVYAQGCSKRKDNIVAMISLETIGYYSDQPNSQKYPPPLDKYYPSTGNFVGFVANLDSGKLLKQAIGSFRRHASFPSEGGALPPLVPGVGWSDHWSFWKFRYPAIMVTDTAPFRYPDYHKPTDTPDKIDYDRMARVIEGLRHVVDDLLTLSADPE